MVTQTNYEHIVLDEHGRPVIAATGMRVSLLVAERIAWGWSPEEILLNHPELTLGQIFSALAYYADHQDQIDQAIKEELGQVEAARKHAISADLSARLRRRKSQQ